MRTKEEAQDYRYFPDPDILPITIREEDIVRIKQEMPMLPKERRKLYEEQYLLSAQDSKQLTTNKYISDYFETCVKLYNVPKKISNWILTDLLRLVKDQEEYVFPISEESLVEIIKIVEDKKITKVIGLELLDKVITCKQSPLKLAKELNLLTIITDEQIEQILLQFKEENPKAVEQVKTDPKVISFIIGYVMKHTQGKANGAVVKELVGKMFVNK